MDLNEMLRLAGAEDGAESFQVALDGKAPAGSQLPSARVRQALGEARGGGDIKQAVGGSMRLYGRIRVAVDALGEVYEVLCDLWKALDRLRYGEDPESGIGDAAGKLLDGPMTDVEKLVKGIGYALDSRFDARRESERASADHYVSRGYRDIDAMGVHLYGEVAEALAVLEMVAPLLDKATATDVYSVDLDLWKTAAPAFIKNVRSRVGVVTAALDKLMVRKITQEYASESEAAYEHRESAVDILGKAVGEELRNGREESPEWGFGLGESAGTPEHLAVPGHGTVALVPTDADAYEVRSVRAGKVGAHSYGVIRAGKLAKVTAGYESLMEATLKAAVQEALAVQGTATAMQAVSKDARAYVGKAFVQHFGNDSLWVLGTRAVKSDQVLVSLVRAFEDKNTAERATAAHLKLADLQAYEEHSLRDVPAPVLAQWRDSGALEATRRALSAHRSATTTVPLNENANRKIVDVVVQLLAKAALPTTLKKAGARIEKNGAFYYLTCPFPAPMPALDDFVLHNARVLGNTGAQYMSIGFTVHDVDSDDREGIAVKVPVQLTKEWYATATPVTSAVRTSSLSTVGQTTESANAGKSRAVFVAKITVPAARPSVADEMPDRWAAEEKKMAADFELAMERAALKSAKAPKARVKVSQVGFKKTGAAYALHATVEISGDGVSSLDDELITALDQRTEAAVDAVIDNGEQAADVAFRNVDWKHVTIDVM